MLSRTLWRAARTSYGVLSKVPGVDRAKSYGVKAAGRAGWTAWATLRDGSRLRVDLANSVGRSIWFRGSYDDDLVRFVLDPLEPGDAFVDVGANVGYYTALAARKVGDGGCVFAVEPSPAVAALLAASIADNAWGNVVLLAVAATSEPSLLRFRSEQNSGWSHVAATGDRVVAGFPLDDVVGPLLEGRPLRAVKVDVEGHELEALSGMRRLVESPSVERVLTEAHVAQGHPWLERLFGFFEALGYRSVDPISGREITISDVSPDLWNVGFVR
ncbi:MAG: FkbM family methyltransferase [Myxococcota bacterium]